MDLSTLRYTIVYDGVRIQLYGCHFPVSIQCTVGRALGCIGTKGQGSAYPIAISLILSCSPSAKREREKPSYR